MAFWLARQRRGQEHSHIQRFDPRFWTIEFQRPASASVVTTGPDGLRVDCEFHHKGELAELVWDSVDRVDHPLLAYETSLDYSRTTVSFRWQSTGLIALDQANGPSLKIEGRDSAGQAKTWQVRLWNHASGSPTDALIELPFSNLRSGSLVSGEQVYPAAIDRLSIELAPPGHVAGSTARLPQRANGHVALSNIVCDGANAMLEIGDVLLPVHGERMATAYDEACRQTPARLVRSMFGLGYRQEVLHELGTHSFPRLAGESALEVTQPAELSAPASQWHQSFLAQCRDHGFDTRISLSFALADACCPDAWQQRSHDGAAAVIGGDAPTAFLSPASGAAMSWLQQVAVAVAGLQQAAMQPVSLQLGQPRWWITAQYRPCLYDASAVAAFGGSPPQILDLRGSLNAAQKGLLNQAGTLLAQASAGIAAAVRIAASGDADVSLLVSTPAALDPQMPEAHRANLPPGWSYPAFDRLQIEDNDWLIAGHVARRHAAFAEAAQSLAYPGSRQEYLAGTAPADSAVEQTWTRIDQGLDDAAARAIGRRFIRALQHVSRDGYTRLAPPAEEPMQAFDNVLYPFALGRATAVSPEFSTSVVVTASGHERRNSLWSDARLHFDVGPGIRSEEELSELIAFFRARRGAARSFLISDPFDFSSRAMTGTPTPYDQLIGRGDGVRTSFPLVKRYGATDPQVRPITRPRDGTVRVSVNDVEVSGWTLADRGIVEFEIPPQAGALIAAGFLFDIPVRFADDRIDISGFNFAAGEAPSIALLEVREAD